MQQYHDALRTILEHGETSTDRTGTGTISYFGHQSRYRLSDGFPLVTTKKLHLRSIIHELLWFLSGDTNIRYLKENGVTIWDEWADENGDLGPVYGHQWRAFPGPVATDLGTAQEPLFLNKPIDQIAQLVEMIKTSPDSRRLVVTAWNPADVPRQALPPCHTLWQVRVSNGRLHLQLYQRSADMFLGVPFNIASYALLQVMLAHVTGYQPGISSTPWATRISIPTTSIRYSFSSPAPPNRCRPCASNARCRPYSTSNTRISRSPATTPIPPSAHPWRSEP